VGLAATAALNTALVDQFGGMLTVAWHPNEWLDLGGDGLGAYTALSGLSQDIRANLRAGPATYGSLFEVQPFANVLYRMDVSGADLRAYLEKLVARSPRVHVSGIVVQYDSTRTAGPRITSIRMADGTALRDDARYRLVLNDFLATGGDGLGLGAAARSSEPLPIVDLDAMVDYLRAMPQPVRAPADRRLVNTAGAP